MSIINKVIKIFLIERQNIVREGMKALLEEERDFQVCNSSSKDVKFSSIQNLQPDILLISLDNLDENDFSYINIFHELNKKLKQFQYSNKFKIIVYGEKVDEQILNRALQLGCDGYLLKESPIEELKQAIRSVHNGYKHIGNSVFDEINKLSNRQLSRQNNFIKKEHYYTGLSVANVEPLISEELNLSQSRTAKNLLEHDEIPSANLISDPTLSSVKNSEDSDNNQLLLKPTANKNSLEKLRQVYWGILPIAIVYVMAVVTVLLFDTRQKKVLPTISQSGIVRRRKIELKTPYSGKIRNIAYQVGDVVGANESILQIEPDYSIQKKQLIAHVTENIERIKQEINRDRQLLETAQNNLAVDKEQLKLLITSNKPNNSKINKLEQDAATALQNWQRLKKLEQQGIVSKFEVMTAKQAWDNIQNRIDSNLSFKDKNEPNTIGQLETQIEQRKSQIKVLRQAIAVQNKNLDAENRRWQDRNSDPQPQTVELKAPSMGVVEAINRDVTGSLAEKQTVVKLLDCQNTWVETIVNSQALEKIKLDSSVLVELENYPNDISANISSIRATSKTSREFVDESEYQLTRDLNSFKASNVESESLFKITIDLPLANIYSRAPNICGVGDTAMVTFNN